MLEPSERYARRTRDDATVQRTPTDATSSTTGGRTLRTATVTDAMSSSKREDLVGDAIGQCLEQEIAALGRGATGEASTRRRSSSFR